tara:strand:+ start:101 stop:310 length:210 start_codon:yes stop_codon:yes gene_type:complete
MRGLKVKALRKSFKAYAAANGKFPNENQRINRRKGHYPMGHRFEGWTFETFTIINPFKAAFRRLKKVSN